MKAVSFALLLLALGLPVLAFQDRDTATSSLPAAARSKSDSVVRDEHLRGVVAYCKSIVPHQADIYRDFIRELATRGDHDALRAIYQSDFVFSEWAAEEYVETLPSKDVVRFCRQFPLGKANWFAVCMTFRSRPKEFVIDYIKRVVKTPDPIVKYTCYMVCLNAGWGDLVSDAQVDKDFVQYIYIPNISKSECRVDLVAELYLRTFAP